MMALFDPMLQPFGPFKLSFDKVYHDEGQDVLFFWWAVWKMAPNNMANLLGKVFDTFWKHIFQAQKLVLPWRNSV